MNIHEHQAKEILKKFGILVPKGVAIFDLKEIKEKIKSLDPKNLVLKAQIHSGGRGKAGGIKKINSYDNLIEECDNIQTVRKEKGKLAITNYKTLKIFQNLNLPKISLIKCELETGRTHQIRVHMSHKGNNILGDEKYRKKFKKLKNIDPSLEKFIYNLNRQFLHAKVLGFIHPKSGKKLRFSSILPNELMTITKTLRNIDK